MILLKQFNISNVDELQIISNDLIKAILTQLKHSQLKDTQKSMHIFLKGTLGVGKTAFMKNFLKSLGYQGIVKSPSYAILNSYDLNQFDKNASVDVDGDEQAISQYIDYIHHFDAYRIQSLQQWFDYQFDDCFAPRQLSFIEWPEHCQDALSAADFALHFEFSTADSTNQTNQTNQTSQTNQNTTRLISLYASTDIHTLATYAQ